MPEEFQPLLMENLEIRVSGSSIQRVALNRHMPKVDEVKIHDHEYHQWLLYLRGSGYQVVGDATFGVRRGTLITLSKGQSHGFLKEKSVSPLCLAIDFVFDEEPSYPQRVQISGDAINSLEQGVHQLGKSGANRTGFGIASGVLGLVSTLEQELKGKTTLPKGRYSTQVADILKHADLNETNPAQIASLLDTTVENLNRQLKRESRTTIGRLLSQERFERACELLETTSLEISQVAEMVGILDQNYFARWFRKQAGITPSQWRDASKNSIQ